MRMTSGGSPFEFYQFRRGSWDFYRCYKCHRVFTYEQEQSRIARMDLGEGLTICPCRSMRYGPARPAGIEWLKPSVITYTGKLVLARGVAPWVEKRLPSALPLIERLSKPIGPRRKNV